MNISKAILSSTYLGPIQWYSKLLLHNEVVIDQHEHFQKQTWRNRCRIVGPNGIQDLIIPVHISGNHTPMNEVRIDYDGIWQRQHWQSIRSAYGNSPFFDFYADHFSPFYENRKWGKLIEFNSELLELSLKLLKLEVKLESTKEYVVSNDKVADFRNLISPKKSIQDDVDFKPNHYVQVFEERHGFIPNMSVLDLLCCCGPASREVIGFS